MLSSSFADAPADHPWLETFLASPDEQLDNLLFGYAQIEPYEAASSRDLVRLIFSPLAETHPAIASLDRAVLAWLSAKCSEESVEDSPQKLDRKRQAIADAIRFVSLVPLLNSARTLRVDLHLWMSFSLSLLEHSRVDVCAEYLSTLALTQRFVTEKGGLPPFELEPFWLKICETAGSDFPSSYLSIALLGLRKLPERDAFPSERPWVTGLSRWAAVQNPPAHEFLKQWEFLKDLYPRTSRHWRRAVEATLAQVPSKDISEELRKAWKASVGIQDDKTPTTYTKNSEIAKNFDISVEEVNNLLDEFDQPYANLVDRINNIVAARVRYTEISGDTFHLTKSAGRIAASLMRSGPEHEEAVRAKKAIELSRLVIHWEPNNPYAWSTWRMALERIGDFASAEIVGWEAIRRFPEEVKYRSQLFAMLIRLSGREIEAEQLIRSTIAQFPEDALSPTQLALFLTSVAGRHGEAEAMFLETIKRFPTDPYPRSQLAEMYLADGRIEEAAAVVADGEQATDDHRTFYDIRSRIAYTKNDLIAAEAILRDGLVKYRGDWVLQRHLSQLLQGKPLRLRSVAYGTVSPEREIQSSLASAVTPQIHRSGRLRRIWGKVLSETSLDAESRSRLENEILGVLAEDRHSSYGNFVYEAVTGKQLLSAADAPFELAFARALRLKDTEAFERLSMNHRHLTDVAKLYLFGDKAAAERTAAWLQKSPDHERRADVALRSLLTMRVGAHIIATADELRTVLLEIVPANENVYLDLIDATFVPSELPMAA